MWLQNEKFNILLAAAYGKKTAQLNSLITDINNSVDDGYMPTACPTCHKELIHQSLPFLNLPALSCPDQHGVWLSQNTCLRFQKFAGEQIVLADRRRIRMNIYITILSFLLTFLTVSWFTKGGDQEIAKLWVNWERQSAGEKIGPDHWPERDFSQWYPLPAQPNGITDQDELLYFQRYMPVMEKGIVNRFNIQTAFDARRDPADYLAVYNIYAARQHDFLAQLSGLQPPQRLQEFHSRIIAATNDQIKFYNEYARKKYAKPKLQLNQLLADPHLKSCHEKLWGAYLTFQELYPAVDKPTNDAIERRLCYLDVI